MRALDPILNRSSSTSTREKGEGLSFSPPPTRGRGEGEGLRALLLLAVPAEADALRLGLNLPPAPPQPWWTRTELTPRLDLVITGVGKSNAAAAAARTLDPARHACALNLGIAGALTPLKPGALVLATRSTLADEGMRAPDGFHSLAQMNFPPLPHSADGMSVNTHPRLLEALASLATIQGPIATVSTCAANDALAHERAALAFCAEAMEGAAVGTVALALNIPFAEVRAISNTTGDRTRQRWDLRAAFDALARLAPTL